MDARCVSRLVRRAVLAPWSGAGLPAAGRTITVALLALLALAGSAGAQCEPPANSNEAKLLAFYSAPIVFSPAAAPELLAPGSINVSFEVVPIPTPDPSIEQTRFCYEGKSEDTHLAPVFGRPRITVGLPMGFALEASYVPPVKMWDAEPNLGSVALSNVRRLPIDAGGGSITLLLRAQGTFGQVQGPITCSESGLQVADRNEPCFGTEPSSDTFHPYMFGGEGALGFTTRGGRLSVYAGGGVNWLRPRFQVGFTDGIGVTDSTRISVNLTRGAMFGGLTARVVGPIQLSAQVYDLPRAATTWRFGVGYQVR